MTFTGAMLLGAAVGGGVILGWLEGRRIERVELDESWQKFKGTRIP